MAIIYQIPTTFSSHDGSRESNNLENALKADSIVKGFRDALAKENFQYIIRRNQVGGSPSALRAIKAQRKRRQIIMKAKERNAQKKLRARKARDS